MHDLDPHDTLGPSSYVQLMSQISSKVKTASTVTVKETEFLADTITGQSVHFLHQAYIAVSMLLVVVLQCLQIAQVSTIFASDFQCVLPLQVEAFMTEKEQEALAFVRTMVKHQKAVFTSNPRFVEMVTNAFEDIRAYQNALHGHAALVQQLENAHLRDRLEVPPEPPLPTYRVAWDSYPELRVSIALLTSTVQTTLCSAADHEHYHQQPLHSQDFDCAHACSCMLDMLLATCHDATGLFLRYSSGIDCCTDQDPVVDAGASQQNAERVRPAVNSRTECHQDAVPAGCLH